MIEQPSEPQQEIFDTWLNSPQNILIQAVAGSGKTTTLMHIMEVLCKRRTLFLAFNTSIQEEIQERIIQQQLTSVGRARTLHSIGFEALRGHYRKVKLMSGKGKSWMLIKQLQERFRPYYKGMDWKDKMSLNYTLIDMNEISRLFLTNDLEEVITLRLKRGKAEPDDEGIAELWEGLLELREANDAQSRVIIDFTDMIYLPVVKSAYIPIRPTYLMMDECQDLNIAQHALVDLLINQGDVEKWIAVGDRNQAIYGFSGASAESFDLFARKENTTELPLNICYRCDQLIIEEANQVYDCMIGFSNTPGTIEHSTNPDSIEDHSIVICRNSAPLVKLYFHLLSKDRKCYIKGEDILNEILNFVKPYQFKSNLEAYFDMRDKLKELQKQKDKELEAFILEQNMANFISLVKHLSSRHAKVEELKAKIGTLFVEKKDAIMLSTIHKSKGLESDTVYFLNPDLIPSRFAHSDEELTQEANLRYVAITRAKHKLVYLTIEKEE